MSRSRSFGDRPREPRLGWPSAQVVERMPGIERYGGGTAFGPRATACPLHAPRTWSG